MPARGKKSAPEQRKKCPHNRKLTMAPQSRVYLVSNAIFLILLSLLFPSSIHIAIVYSASFHLFATPYFSLPSLVQTSFFTPSKAPLMLSSFHWLDSMIPNQGTLEKIHFSYPHPTFHPPKFITFPNSSINFTSPIFPRNRSRAKFFYDNALTRCKKKTRLTYFFRVFNEFILLFMENDRNGPWKGKISWT